jgi:hypothetical protein
MGDEFGSDEISQNSSDQIRERERERVWDRISMDLPAYGFSAVVVSSVLQVCEYVTVVIAMSSRIKELPSG